MAVLIWLALYLLSSLAVAFWLRHHFAWAQRLNDCNWQAWVLLDIVAAFCLFWPLYLLSVVDDRPGNGLTISAYCGRNALMGRRWARIASALIDRLFRALTSQRDHCAKAYTRWANPLGDFWHEQPVL